ncbi:MAG: ABC transporter substrate-binding protein [Chloroflexi bacterium]|nr:ABC transporter substrate-binding protein [Chloroflexota bacterium]
MATKNLDVRFVFRSISMVELMTIMEREGYWEDHGVDVRLLEFSDDATRDEERLFSGDIDFILGDHVSPYKRIAEGHPMVCLGQTVNFENVWIATTQEITSLPMLTGKRVVGKPLWTDGRHIGHHDGTKLLFLNMQGVDTERVDWVDDGSTRNTEGARSSMQIVSDGDADACFIAPRRADAARKAGLRVYEFPPFPMIKNMTLTSMLPSVLKDSELARRVIHVMTEAAEFFISNREETLTILRDPVYPLPEGWVDHLATQYDERAAEYEPTLFPNPEGIVNVHRLSAMLYPEVKQMNPLELWDLRLLHEVRWERQQRAAAS